MATTTEKDMATREKDVESGKRTQLGYYQRLFDQGAVTPEVINHPYSGAGTDEDPYIVKWIPNDPRNPMEWPTWYKWVLTQLVAIATLAVAFVSSAYTGGLEKVIVEFGVSQEVVTLGVSLFVLGFALGPLIWAPCSELYGRQILFFGTYAMLTFFNAGAAGSQNIQTLLILRFFAGAFGSSPLTNAGGVIADIFPAAERGLALTLFAAAPFLGPVIGPIVGGFAGEAIGWRWVEGIMAIFTGVLWIMCGLLVPETYAPVLLRKRAARLSKLSGKVYRSQADAEQGRVSAGHAFKTALSRPWVLLFREPIVFLLSLYMAIIYGTLYMMFAAYPIVYQVNRGWSPGIGALPFLGVAVGMLLAVAYSIWDNKRYLRAMKADPNGIAPPESRLPPAMLGGVCIVVGLFWFAWTNYPSIFWLASVAAGAPFGFGMVLVFLAIMNYLIDAYVIFAASVLAANAVLRSLFGAAFPLFTSYMYNNLGIHWATTIPGFLALICVPFPFVLYKYGPAIRTRCKYAAEAAAFMDRMRNQQEEEQKSDGSESAITNDDEKLEREADLEGKEHEDVAADEDFDYNYENDGDEPGSSKARFRQIKPGGATTPRLSRTATGTSQRYDANPFDLDRVATRESFAHERLSQRTSMTSVRTGTKSGGKLNCM